MAESLQEKREKNVCFKYRFEQLFSKCNQQQLAATPAEFRCIVTGLAIG